LHPSSDGSATAMISEIRINGDLSKILSYVKEEYGYRVIDNDELIISTENSSENEKGIISIKFKTQSGVIEIK
jgi:hypothetical protein